MSHPNTANAQQPTRLISHFLKRPVQDYGPGWSALWDSNNSDLWDRGKPSPALIDLIEQQPLAFSPFTADGRRKKALVPGCGRGYDVIMLALHGFDAYGLEISATAVAEARKYAAVEMSCPQEYNFGHAQSQTRDVGSAIFAVGDFFESEWEGQGILDARVKYDLVYDYTFLCALHPQMRAQWAARMAQLVLPQGVLVCHEFPMYKDPLQDGPPWGVNGVHWDLLARGGDGMAGISQPPEATTDGLCGAFQRVQYFMPKRSYESGKGTDMMSVYERK
ncbi:thiopurine S-methyltransferase family protein [Aspergillus candidus]|uniref:Thiopurine S-methyltransferase family protein n=1 Tax=Aspergillus candidus TaxID=41067 RepID=A0A2I2FJ85_ASPCN|nr:thiopurine S-methyltransferase family protein [Aspergillus candidus]PLB40682.1 thiopurine S-methyltransferase family protein [Aspergillus candidus]